GRGEIGYDPCVEVLDGGKRLLRAVWNAIGPSNPAEIRRIGKQCDQQSGLKRSDQHRRRNRQLSKAHCAAEKQRGPGVKSDVIEIASHFEIVTAKGVTVVVQPLVAVLRAVRRKIDIAAERTNAGDVDARAEWIRRIQIEDILHELKPQFVDGPRAKNVILAGNPGLVMNRNIDAARWTLLTTDPFAVVAVVR